MPELPDIEVYLHALERRIIGEPLVRVSILSPSLLRTYDPPISELEGRRVVSIGRVGKRIVWEMQGDLFVVIHLMVSGRLQWRTGKAGRSLAAFRFPQGTLVLTEASKTKRASLHLLRGGVDEMDRGGIDPLSATQEQFATVLARENRTLKRALTDPSWFSGIGNAYSDEILHRARLSPLQRTERLTAEQIERLHGATSSVLTEWTTRLLDQAGDKWPTKVTAFHPEMAVHGKFGEPCPVCGSPVQRIVHADNETNYCPVCQTGGRLLADRARSRFLKDARPRRVEDL
ncbi:MAG: DNA-formamidopyrimidine glycosylase family protein [Acidimicrobiia bacterium]